MLDVAIIGGGPVGSRTAYSLSIKGYHVAVLEKHIGIGEKSCCTGIISQSCAAEFAISQDVIFQHYHSARIFSPSGDSVRVYHPQPQACIINRRAFDCALAAKAESAGVEYQLNTRVENIELQRDRVKVLLAEKNKQRQLEARTVVLANGFNSVLTKRLGLGQPGYFVAGVQAEVDINGLPEVEVYFNQELAPGFFAWLVPTAAGKGKIGLLTRQSPGLHLRRWITRLIEEGKIKPGAYPLLYSGIPLKPISRTFDERLLVVGDAAGQVKPTTGGGIYFGMLCADFAADTLHKSFTTGEFSSKSLSGYESRWRKKLGGELSREYFSRRLYERLNNRQIDGLFSRLKASGMIDSLLREDDLSFDWHGGLISKVLKYNLQHIFIRG